MAKSTLRAQAQCVVSSAAPASPCSALNLSLLLHRPAMEPCWPLLLGGVSLPLTRALQGNETTTADGNWTTATSGNSLLPGSPVLANPTPRL